MDEAARVAYLRRLDAEVLTADAELAELEGALQAHEGCGPPDNIPELGWARARCETLRSWAEVLQRHERSLEAFEAEGAAAAASAHALAAPARTLLLQARAEQARGELLRARLLVHERLMLLRQECAFRHEAQLRMLEEVYARAETAAARQYPAADRSLQLSLAWLRCELHAAWRLMERVLRADDRDWAHARRDFERALDTLSHSAQRLATSATRSGRRCFA